MFSRKPLRSEIWFRSLHGPCYLSSSINAWLTCFASASHVLVDASHVLVDASHVLVDALHVLVDASHGSLVCLAGSHIVYTKFYLHVRSDEECCRRVLYGMIAGYPHFSCLFVSEVYNYIKLDIYTISSTLY